MNLMQKKLMSKYYGSDNVPRPTSHLKHADAQTQSANAGYFHYCGRGTAEFMRGGSRG